MQIVHKAIGNSLSKQHKGFTLIELIVVIIVLGVLSVTAISRLPSGDDFERSANCAQTLSALRQLQLQAMNLVDEPDCCTLTVHSQSIQLAASSATALGWPNRDVIRINAGDSTQFQLAGNTNQTLSIDTLGRLNGVCANGCDLSLTTGSVSENIHINAEGYIRACQ